MGRTSSRSRDPAGLASGAMWSSRFVPLRLGGLGREREGFADSIS